MGREEVDLNEQKNDDVISGPDLNSLAQEDPDALSTTKMANKKEEGDVSVTREDQGMINAFSRHNVRHVEITDKLTELKKQLDNINEAKEELELQLEEGQVPVKIGEVFVHFEQDDTTPYLDQLQEKLEKQARELEAEATTVKETMSGLKGRLYAKFGNSINLESD